MGDRFTNEVREGHHPTAAHRRAADVREAVTGIHIPTVSPVDDPPDPSGFWAPPGGSYRNVRWTAAGQGTTEERKPR